MRYIIDNCMLEWFSKGKKEDVQLSEIIDTVKTADVIEVVRCKDCKIHNHCVVEEKIAGSHKKNYRSNVRS